MINGLKSVKTGGCAENCGYCAQSQHFQTGLKASKLMEADAVIALGVDVIKELVLRLVTTVKPPSPSAVRQAAALIDSAVTGVQEGIQKSRGKPFVEKLRQQRLPLRQFLLDHDVLITVLKHAPTGSVVNAVGNAVRLVFTLESETGAEVAPLTQLLLDMAEESPLASIREQAATLANAALGQ